MTIPFNNGKVKMGIYHQHPKYVEQDNDMLALQGCLIGDAKAIRRRRLANKIYIALLAFVILTVILV
jgi:putative ubiquitin-RnfH superfamily antitoxin RatB of RatAB toxin-antitoxin module